MGFDFEVIGMNAADFPTGPEDGVYVKGMFLEGCGYDADKKVLCESQPKVRTGSLPSARSLRSALFDCSGPV